MKQKLIDYIKENRVNFTHDNIFCYVEDKEHPMIIYALYEHEDTKKVCMYNSTFSQVCLETDNLAPFYQEMEIDTEMLVEIKRSEWKQYRKTSIQNELNEIANNSDEYEGDMYFVCIEEVKENGGKIVKYNNLYYMLVAICSSDEDYYYVLAGFDADNNVVITEPTALLSLEYIKDDEYTLETIERHDFIHENRDKIIEKLQDLDEVIFTDIVTKPCPVSKK